MAKALAYLRTSSAANVDGDSAFRQNDAVMAFAARNDLNVVACYWDAAVSGADPIETRAGFVAMLAQASEAGIKVIIVENATRFARDLLVQELALQILERLGLTLVSADGVSFEAASPMAKAMRQIAGAMAELDKAMTVAKLKHGRERARVINGGKCEGRKAHAELNPVMVREAKRLARKSPKTGKARSLREIALELMALGYVNGKRNVFSASAVKSMLEG
jgi:DNA invertase Pin-like site-specific DNA recombinase